MRRVVALMLVFMFMMSHGSMGSAAPHADHHDAHGETAVGDHLHPSSSDGDEPASDVGHATHVHVVVALPEPQAFNAAAPVGSSLIMRPLVVTEPASRGVAPLLEPPSA
jgi:hypothetical protein